MSLEDRVQADPVAVVNPEHYGIAPLERLIPPCEFDGQMGARRLSGSRSIAVETDLEAVQLWVDHPAAEQSRRARRSAAEKLLNWAYVERKKALSSFEREDFGDFLNFMASPSPAWLWIAARGVPRSSPSWRPYVGPASAASLLAVGRQICSLCTYLREQGYADLQFLFSRRGAREGLVDSKYAFQAGVDSFRTQVISYAEWEWVGRWLSQHEANSNGFVERIAVELLYHAELKLFEVVSLSGNELRAPDKDSDGWRVEIPRPTGETISQLLNLPFSLNAALTSRFGNGQLGETHSLKQNSPLVAATSDGLAVLVKRVFRGAAALAEASGDQKSGEALRKRTPMSLRHAKAAHVARSPVAFMREMLRENQR